MQSKINQTYENGERHGYWKGCGWTANFIHGDLFGYSEDFSHAGKLINREYYAR